MGRPKKERKRKYKEYYEREGGEIEIPESTLRYRMRKEARTHNLSLENGNEFDHLGHNVTIAVRQSSNSSFIAHPLRVPSAPEQRVNVSVGEMGGSLLQTSNTRPTHPTRERREDVPSQSSTPLDVQSETTSSSISDSSDSNDGNDCDGEIQSVISNNSGVGIEYSNADESFVEEMEMASVNTSWISESSSDNSQDAVVMDEETNVNQNMTREEATESVDNDVDEREAAQPQDNDMYEGETAGLQDNDMDEDLNHGPMQVKDNFVRLRSAINGGAFKKQWTLKVDVTIGDILTNALSLADKHNWNNTEKEDIMIFANSLLNMGRQLPCSRYMLDQYLFSKSVMHYYFFCKQCTTTLGNCPAESVRCKQIICPKDGCGFVNVLSDLSKASFFVTFDLPQQIEFLLKDEAVRTKLVNPVDFIDPPADGIMRDLHHGTAYRAFANRVKNDPSANGYKVISFSLSIDSASLCFFSKHAVCPCFIMVNELPTVIRMKKLLIAGLWFGVVKEKLDLFLPPIVEHITKLSLQGFTVNLKEETWLMKGYLLACVADSVARCDVQGIHSHRGDYPCSWCLHEGEEFEGKRIFRYFDAPPRTVAGLMNDAYRALNEVDVVQGVKYFSPLAAAPYFHPVHGFIVEGMHAKDEGNTKYFLKSWLGEDGSKVAYYIGNPENLKELNKLGKEIRPPKEFRRSLREIEDWVHWTGRELENWEYYFSIPLLVNMLPNVYLKHWAKYVQGTYILYCNELSLQAIGIANQLINEFCRQTERLYGLHMMRFNLHILRHFCENARRYGPMFALCAYAFEAGNQEIKKLVDGVVDIPNQICRGLSEKQALDILRKNCESAKTQEFLKKIDKNSKKRMKCIGRLKLLGLEKQYCPTEEEEWFINRRGLNVSDFKEYEELKKDGCSFTSSVRSIRCSTDNSYARLADKKFIHIKKILFNEITEDILIVGSKIRYKPSPFCPAEIVAFDPDLCFQYVVTSVDQDIELYEVSELTQICVSLPLYHGHYISPMAHIFNIF